jgi:sacsin
MIFCHEKFGGKINIYQNYPLVFQEMGKNSRDGYIYYKLIQPSQVEWVYLTSGDYFLTTQNQRFGPFQTDYRNYYLYLGQELQHVETSLATTPPPLNESLEQAPPPLPPIISQVETPQALPENFEELLNCPITQVRMIDPVILMDGFSYERRAIENWLRNHSRSPMTNIPLPNTALIPNRTLRNIIHEIR